MQRNLKAFNSFGRIERESKEIWTPKPINWNTIAYENLIHEIEVTRSESLLQRQRKSFYLRQVYSGVNLAAHLEAANRIYSIRALDFIERFGSFLTYLKSK